MQGIGGADALTADRHDLGRLCFAFHARMTARALTRAYDAALRPLGLGAPQFGVLGAIALDLGLSETALSERLGLERTTLVRNLRLLQRKGWIEPVPGPDRALRHRLTASGEAMLAAARPRWAAIQTRIESALGREEANAALQSLRHLRRAAYANLDPARGDR